MKIDLANVIGYLKDCLQSREDDPKNKHREILKWVR